MAFSLTDESNSQGVINLYNVETGELTPVTSPMFSCTDPAFDREGKFLYFTSQRNFSPTYSDIDTTYIYNDSGVILAVPLNEEIENPFLAKSDEVEWKTDEDKADKDKENGDEEKADDADKGGEKKDADDEGAEDKSDDAKSDEKTADSEEAEDPFADYDTESPLWGIWEGTAKGLSQMPAPPGANLPDEISVKLTFLVKKDGAMTVISEAMGQEDESTTGKFDAATNTYTNERSENGMTIRSRGVVDGDKMTGTTEYVEMGVTLTWELTKSDEEITAEMIGAKGGGGKDKPVEITLDGLEERAIQLDKIEPGMFRNLAVNDKNQLLYIRMTAGEPPAIKLYDIDDDEKGERNVLAGVGGFTISADGKKLGAGSPGGLVIVDASPGQSLAKPLDTSMMVGRIDPRDEWKQIFNDAWRIQRDFFYEQNMHGVDWDYMRERYGAMVDDAVTREDLSYIIRELISELNIGHAYYFGGDVEHAPSENVGMLGCDFELATTDDGTAYRIKKIYQGAPWDSDARGPLSQPGVDVKEGDFLLAVNGIPMDTTQDPWAPFQRMAGKVTELTVSEKPVQDDDARTVLVKPVGSDFNLRYRAWIEKNRQYVDYKTGGNVGYIYVPNTGLNGQNDLYRQFYGQRNKGALIIDERWNGGGQIPTRFIELLNRPATNFWARRDGKDWMWPPDSHQGPQVMLINGLAGSGGDMFPALFRQAGLGKIIGTRTWGGLVGISGNPPLIDGGYTSVPTFGFYELNGTWGIEGHGVDPDIRVEADPAQMVSLNGEVADPQLDVAIETVSEELRDHPFVPPARPAPPDRSGMGVREEDK
jgi:C-terminal processing protease CtpA/Prc